MYLKFKNLTLTIVLFLSANSLFALPSFYIADLMSCNPPSNIRIKDVETNQATINWISKPNAIAYKIKWRKRNEQYTDSNISQSIDENNYIIENLQSGSMYFFKIKSICDDDSESGWSNEYSFITDLSNPSNCNLNFALKDFANNNPGISKFYIQNDEFPNKQLGIDVFLQSVKLIVKHSWTNDLEIKLTSPSGKSTILTSSNGINDALGYGNTLDTFCLEPVIFSDEACNSITENLFPFIGAFKPEEPLYNLYDSLSPLGKWELEIIDKSSASTGFLEFVELDFEPIVCPVPKQISVIPQNDNSALLSWNSNSIVDSIALDLSLDNSIHIYETIPNEGQYLLEGLNNNQLFGITLQSKCSGNSSATSCEKYFTMLCGIPSIREGFDTFDICESGCDDCLSSGVWFNNTSGQNWIVNKGETTTINTGPKSDLYGHGNYAYVESSLGDCNINIASLKSKCIIVRTSANGCDMSFNYHMYGSDIGSLTLEVTTNNGSTWQTLFFIEHQNEDNWINQTIDLSDYKNRTCSFRFTAYTIPDGNYGDIAIDDIIFYNSILANDETNLFYPDRDRDGFGKDTIGIFFCNNINPLYVKNNDDCNDNNYLINPLADEIPCNFIDENCNGMEDDSQTENPIIANLEEITIASCNGRADGSIIISATNGIPPYSFLWSNSSTDSILTNVPSGKYWCEIRDQSGCGIITDTFYVDHDNFINFVLIEKIEPQCNGLSNGEIIIGHNGGIAPFNYQWSNGETTKNISNLQAGFYTVTITDNIGCKDVSPEIELNALTTFDIVVLDKIEPSCYDLNNGSIELRVSGGTPPYQYHWNNNADTKKIINLKAGEYYCTITDADLCFHEYGPVILNQPDSLNVFVSAIDYVTCIGQKNGSIELSTVGGTHPYTYSWIQNNGSFSSSADDIYNLSSGKYSVIVNDFLGCQKFIEDIEIKTIDSISVALDSVKNVTCGIIEDGYIKISASNGYGDYSYYWNNGTTLTDSINNISTGLYGVTVTDELGCKQVLNNIEVENLNIPIEVNTIVLDSILCYNNKSGSIEASINSLYPPYDYNWNAGTTGNIREENIDTLNNIGIGIYNVTVTDNKGCVGYSENIQLTQPEKLIIEDTEIDEILCFGDNTGRIELSISGGVPPYNIFWNDTTMGKEITKLNSDYYYATITDSNNCISKTDTIFLSQPNPLSVNIESQPAHKDKSDGSARILPEGGVSPYEFLWDENANNQTGNEAFDLATGWYTVSMTDANDCFKEILVYISEIVATTDINLEGLEIYPNPVDNVLTLSFKENISKDFKIELYDIAGLKVPINPITNQKTINIPIYNLPNGAYTLRLYTQGEQYFNRVVIMH